LFESYRDILTIDDIQTALGIGRSMAYRLISDDKIKHWKIGKRIKIPKAFLIDYVNDSCYDRRVIENSPSEGGINNDGESI